MSERENTLSMNLKRAEKIFLGNCIKKLLIDIERDRVRRVFKRGSPLKVNLPYDNSQYLIIINKKL